VVFDCVPDLVLELKRIMALDRPERRIKENVMTHRRLAYSVASIFAEVKVRKRKIQVRFFEAGVSDLKNLVTDITLVDYYAMAFVEASYRSHRAD
jgi:hypothetical protein